MCVCVCIFITAAEKGQDLGHRAERFLNRLFNDDRTKNAKLVMVTSHSHFMSALMQTLGHSDYYHFSNGELAIVLVKKEPK